MAVRKAYLPLKRFPYVQEVPLAFRWSNGTRSQNLQTVLSIFHETYPDVPVLDVSSVSNQPEGISISVRNLMVHTASLEQEAPIGMVYEASKVSDDSGKCIRYCFEENDFTLEPYPYAFFDWIYCCALHQNPDKTASILCFGAFTDFDLGSTKKDQNSPARAAAIYVGLASAEKLSCLESYDSFVTETCAEPAQESAPSLDEQKVDKAPEETPSDTVESEQLDIEQVLEMFSPCKEGETEEVAKPLPPQIIDGVEVPTLEQMMEISQGPKAQNVLVRLAEKAGCVAKTSEERTEAGRELLKTSYQHALRSGSMMVAPGKSKIIFPLQNPETGFRTIGQLTLAPMQIHGWKLGMVSGDPIRIVRKFPTEPSGKINSSFVEDYLFDHGYIITHRVQPDELPPAAVQKLAWEIGEAMHEPAVVLFLQFIRSHLEGNRSITFQMPKNTSKASRELVVELAQHWDRLGLFSNFNANTVRIICDPAPGNDVIQRFLEGHWLELYVVHSVQQLLKHYQEEQNASVSLCSNVVLTGAPSITPSHELDAAFSVNGIFFWIEAKSSSKGIDYGKYKEMCKHLQVKTDQFLMVNSELSEEECEGISYFWSYRVANCVTLPSMLDEMIQKQLAKPKTL